MADKRMYEAIKFTFSADELRELGGALARENQGIYDLGEEKEGTRRRAGSCDQNRKWSRGGTHNQIE
jgi:hypothetical protein